MLFIVVVDIEVVANALDAEWPVVVAVVCVIEDDDVDATAAWEGEMRPCDVEDEDEVDDKEGRSAKGGLSRSRFPIEAAISAVSFADDNGRELSR